MTPTALVRGVDSDTNTGHVSTLRNTDYIDLYQVHRPTPDVDIEETLGALSDLVHQGKVRYIG